MCSQKFFNPKGELMSTKDFSLVAMATNFVARKLKLGGRTTHYVRGRLAGMEAGDHINVGFTGLQVHCIGGLPYGQKIYRVVFDDSWK
mgnify:FL=1